MEAVRATSATHEDWQSQSTVTTSLLQGAQRTSSGSEVSSRNVYRKILGPEQEQDREIRVLNRVLTWESIGIIDGLDQRHAEMIIRELGLEKAGSALTRGTRTELDAASLPHGIPGIKLDEEPELMSVG